MRKGSCPRGSKHRVRSAAMLLERNDFLDTLGTRLEAAGGGEGSLILIAGEAGVGKTWVLGQLDRCRGGHRDRGPLCRAQSGTFPSRVARSLEPDEPPVGFGHRTHQRADRNGPRKRTVPDHGTTRTCRTVHLGVRHRPRIRCDKHTQRRFEPGQRGSHDDADRTHHRGQRSNGPTWEAATGRGRCA